MFQLRLLGDVLCNGDVVTIMSYLSSQHDITDIDKKKLCDEIYMCQDEDFIIVDDIMYIIQRIVKKKVILP